MTSIDRRAVWTFGSLLAAGVVIGLVELVTDADKTSTNAGVAVANWVHVVLAVALLGVVARAFRRSPAELRAFVRRPVTPEGWSALWLGLAGSPLALVPRDLRGRLRAGNAAAAILARALIFVAALATLYAPLRSGLQVFAALDRDFTRDAWGGPTYLGASLAHWLDGAIIFYASSILLATAARSRRDAMDGAGVMARG